MSHEKTITIGVDGGYVNIPTVHKGKDLSGAKAVELYRQGKIRPTGRKHKSKKSAVDAARKRSKGGK